MAWVKLDDQFFDHPKVVAAGPAARDLYLQGLAYACRFLTDGFIPAGQVRRFDAVRPDQLAQQLVSVGLWEALEDGYQIHDYLIYNPRRTVILERRRMDSERKRGGFQSTSNEDSEAIAGGVPTESSAPRARAPRPPIGPQAPEKLSASLSPSPVPGPASSPAPLRPGRARSTNGAHPEQKNQVKNLSGDEDGGRAAPHARPAAARDHDRVAAAWANYASPERGGDRDPPLLPDV